MLTVNCRCQADLAIQAMSQDHSFIDWVFALAGSFTKDPNIEHHGADFVDISLGIIVRNTADPILAFPKIYSRHSRHHQLGQDTSPGQPLPGRRLKGGQWDLFRITLMKMGWLVKVMMNSGMMMIMTIFSLIL